MKIGARIGSIASIPLLVGLAGAACMSMRGPSASDKMSGAFDGAIAENARIPVDNPATHLELTMVHEAMLLESSGRHLALWEYQSALRLTLWLTLIAAIFVPYGTAPAGSGPLAWVPGLATWLLKMGALCLALSAFENAIAKMRVFRVPEFLGAALLLALLAAALLFVSTGLA